MKKTLWSKNFTIITLGTIVSMLGSLMYNFALTLVVFDQTSSSFLSGLFSALAMLPSIIFPLLIAPYMDSHARKPFIYSIDLILGISSILFGLLCLNVGFNYVYYLIFSFYSSCLFSIYYSAHQSLFPELIPEGFKQKGFALNAMVYPIVSVVALPISALIYDLAGIETIMFINGLCLIVASIFEFFIKIDESSIFKEKTKFNFKNYALEIKEGYNYLKNEKGLWPLYSYMAITNGFSAGGSICVVAFFQSSTILTTAMYSIFSASNTVGRFVGGGIQYLFKVKKEHKYMIANFVYKMYAVFDSVVLFLPFPLMIIIQATSGFLGVTSMTLRESAVQNYLPRNMRARVYAFFGVMMNFMIIICKFIAGILGEVLSYRSTFVIFSVLSFIMTLYFIDRNKKEISRVLNVDC